MTSVNDDPNLPGAPEPGTPDPIPSDTERGPDGPAPAAASVRSQNRLALAGTIAVVVALVAGGAFLLGRGSGPGDGPVGGLATPSQPPATTIDPAAPVPTAPASADPYAGLPSEGNRLGRADAPVLVEYWADYQCPFCGTFAQERIPDLLPYVADGTVTIVHRDFAFLGPESYAAAVAVRCADREGRYWAMHDAIYVAQAGENQGGFTRDRLVAVGESIGLDGAALEACLDDRTLLVAVLDDTSAGTRVAIESTPTVDVHGTRFLGMPEAGELEAVIAEAVAGASPQPLPTQVPIQDAWAAIGATGRAAGDPAAPVTVDLWQDYQAPEGAVIAREMGEDLRARAADGRARIVLRDLALLGDESVTAATFVRCIDAQDGPALLISEVLSVSAQGPGSGIYTTDNLLRLGTQLGLDIAALDACLVDDAVAEAVRVETAAGQALGLDAGPAIVITRDGTEVARFSGALDATAVLAAIDQTE